MNKLIVFIGLTTAALQGGCGIVGVVSTPTNYEKKIPAEYPLAQQQQQRILVLVEQPSWLNAQANLRYHVTDRINKAIAAKVEIPSEYLVPYQELSRFRSNLRQFSSLSPAAAGKALNADVVLFVSVEDFNLTKTPEADFYAGFLRAGVFLLDAATGKTLWPESEKSRTIKVGFEIESRGREAAVLRLADALAYCTVRYFYDCPKRKFKIFEDRSDPTWQDWDKHKY